MVGGLVFEHAAFAERSIDPEVIGQPNISAKKLYKTYNDLRSGYNKIMLNFNKSGTHDNDIWNFCQGNTDFLYFFLWLKARANVGEFVDVELPCGVGFNSGANEEEEDQDSDSDNGSATFSDKKRSKSPAAPRSKKRKSVDAHHELLRELVEGQRSAGAGDRLLGNAEALESHTNRWSALRREKARMIDEEGADSDDEDIIFINQRIEAAKKKMVELED